MDEFKLIERFFAPLRGARKDVTQGIGDDGAIVSSPSRELVLAVDTLVEGCHFPAHAPPRELGFRVAAVNLSDLAAMAATPCFATLALTLPSADELWLTEFSSGLGEGLARHNCALVGGDTTRGPLTISLQLIGALQGAPLLRSGACAGDHVLVSGTLGDARAALDLLSDGGQSTDQETYLLARYWRPTPRVELAHAVSQFAHAAIDISDGLLADLGHIAAASGVAIQIDQELLPISRALVEHCPRAQALAYAVTGGDDYELALCVAPAQLSAVLHAARQCGDVLTVIGQVVGGQGVTCRDADGLPVENPDVSGYRHFR